MYKPPFTLIITISHAAGRGELPWESVERRSFHTKADALDFADLLWDDEDQRRKKDARRLPALSALRLEGPSGVLLEGSALRSAARMQRD